MAHSVFVLRTV